MKRHNGAGSIYHLAGRGYWVAAIWRDGKKIVRYAKSRQEAEQRLADLAPRLPDFRARFEQFVQRGPGCWEWTGALSDQGYGILAARASGKLGHLKAHRVSWELEHGRIPRGLQINHHCDNRRCVRPDHLYLGTQAENVADMVSRRPVGIQVG